MRLVHFVAAAAVSLSGCTLIPRYERPEPPVEATWPADPVSESGAELAPEIAWSEFFRSPDLREVVRIALENNRNLRLAVSRIDEARAIYRIERADLFPSIDVAGDGFRQKIPGSMTSDGGSEISSVYNAGLSLAAFELDLFGRLRSSSRAAFEEYLSSDEAARAVKVSLVAETANAYLQWLADEKQLSLAEETLAAQQKSLDLIASSVEHGVGTKLDLAQVRQAVESARAEKARLTRRVEQDKNALVLLMGTRGPGPLMEGASLDSVEIMRDLPVGLPSEVLLTRPDVTAAEHLLRAENARIGAARAAFLPRLSLTGSYGYASTELSDLFSGGSWGAWTFVPQLTLPIFQGGRLMGGLDLSHARKNSAVANYERSIQVAFREVADELAARRTLSEQLDAQRALVAAAKTSYDLSLERYNSGIDSFLAVLDAQRALFSAQQQEIELERQRLSNTVNLYKVLGGGVKDEPASSPA